VGLLAEVLGDEKPGSIDRLLPIRIEGAHDQLGAVDTLD
jgi:hypothetical protein